MEHLCTSCNKSFSTKRNLDRHLERMAGKENHPGEAAPPAVPPASPPEGAAVSTMTPTTTLKIKAPPKQKAADAESYHCVGCGEDVPKGESPCHACGAKLDWEALNARS